MLSSGTWQCVASYDSNDVSEEPTAFILEYDHKAVYFK